jgi:hypothetical protein
MKEARAIAAAAASLPSHCLIISCPKSSPKLQIWTQIFIIITIIIFFFFKQICITQISFFFFFFIQMLLNSWFSIRVWEDTDRQTDRDLSLGSLSVLSCYFGLVGCFCCCCCFLLASVLFLKDLFAVFSEGFFFPFPCSFFFVWVGGWCFSLGEGGCFVRSRKWVLDSSSDPVSDKDFGEYLLPYLVCFSSSSSSSSLSLSLSHTHTHTH